MSPFFAGLFPVFDNQLFSRQDEPERFLFSGAQDIELDLGSAPAAQPIFDHVAEIASLRGFAVDMGDDVADPYASQMGGAAGDQLFHDNLPVGPGETVDADAAEVSGGVARQTADRQQQRDQECNGKYSEHGGCLNYTIR